LNILAQIGSRAPIQGTTLPSCFIEIISGWRRRVRAEFEEFPEQIEKQGRAVVVEEELVLGEEQVVHLELGEDVELIVLYFLGLEGTLGLEESLEDLDQVFLDLGGLPKLLNLGGFEHAALETAG